MSSMEAEFEMIEIADLEYDVGGTASLEPGDAETTNVGNVIWFVPPR